MFFDQRLADAAPPVLRSDCDRKDFGFVGGEPVEDEPRRRSAMPKRVSIVREERVHAGLHEQRLEFRFAPAALESGAMDLGERGAIGDLRAADGCGGDGPRAS